MTYVSLSKKRLAERLVVIVLFTIFIGCGGKSDVPPKAADALPIGNAQLGFKAAQPEMTFEIWHQKNQANAVRVRLDIDALRTYGLSKEDVVSAFGFASMLPEKPKEPLPPPGVVFAPYLKPEEYENIILKATPEGEVVRFKDVATFEPLTTPEAQEVQEDGGSK